MNISLYLTPASFRSIVRYDPYISRIGNFRGIDKVYANYNPNKPYYKFEFLSREYMGLFLLEFGDSIEFANI